MAKLPKSIIKKYGISKKAWSVFRGQKKSRRAPTMARRKKRRSVYRKVKRRMRSSRQPRPEQVILPSIIYGAGRQTLVNLATPVTSMIPLGQYADEAILGVAGYYLAKKGKGILKQVGMSMLTVESASVGSGLIGGGFAGGNNGGAF